MAIGWLTVLKLVPWGEVIKNAPAVADGAKKLWDTVGRKPPPAVADAARQTLADDAPPVDALRTRLTHAEASIAELHEQMQASSALIKALAEQNTELIRRVETNRVRTLWLTVAVLALGVAVALGLAVVLSR